METNPARPKELGVLAKGAVKGVRPLSAKEFAQFEEHCSRILRFAAEQQLFEMVEMNCEDYTHSCVLYRQGFVNGEIGAHSQMRQVQMDLNRRLLNFLSSVRTFLDHTERNLSKNKAKLDVFKKAAAFHFDKSFAYRFMYKLRNYSQHCGLPARLAARKHLPKPDSSKGDATIEFGLMVDRDLLLERYDSWGKVEADLRSMPESFGIDELVAELLRRLHSINNELAAVDAKEAIDAAHWLSNLANEMGSVLEELRPCTPIVFETISVSSVPPRRLKMDVHWFPVQEMAQLLSVDGKYWRPPGGP